MTAIDIGHDDFQAFRAKAGEWLEANVDEEWRNHRGALSEEDQTRLRREWDHKLYEGGYSGLSLPREFGGQGLGVAEEVAFGELAARAQAPDGMARIGKILTAPTLIAHGTDWQKDAYLRPIIEGEHVWCQGFSEPGSGSDLASVRCLAKPVDGGYLVKGTKTWTSFSRQAHHCLLLARTGDPDARHRNLSLFLLDMSQPGITLDPIRQISGTSHFTETHFDNVFVSEKDRVGGENDGWRMAMTVLVNERGTVEAMARYVEIRADLDVLRQCCAKDSVPPSTFERLDARTELIRWQVSKAVSRIDDGPSYSYDAASMGLKVNWSELWQEIVALAARTQCPRHRAHWRFQYLEIRSATIYSGTSEIQRNIVAERVLGLPR